MDKIEFTKMLKSQFTFNWDNRNGRRVIIVCFIPQNRSTIFQVSRRDLFSQKSFRSKIAEISDQIMPTLSGSAFIDLLRDVLNKDNQTNKQIERIFL